MTELVLASASPRRKELLKQITENFLVISSNADEHSEETDPIFFARNASKIKAEEVSKRVDGCVIGADTVVFCGKILLKPKDKQEAFSMLSLLSGNIHKVISGVTVVFCGKTITKHEETTLEFDSFSESEIHDYISTGSPMDKAGAYGLQDDFIKKHTKKIIGNSDNVVGLPVALTKNLLKEIGYIFIERGKYTSDE